MTGKHQRNSAWENGSRLSIRFFHPALEKRMSRFFQSDTSLMEARPGEQPHRFTRCLLLQVYMASGMVETRTDTLSIWARLPLAGFSASPNARRGDG